MTLKLLDDDPLAQRMRQRVMALVAQRQPASLCPSEAARSLAVELGVDWHDLMRLVRAVAADLALRGRIDVTQHGRPVDIREARGPVRLRAHAHA